MPEASGLQQRSRNHIAQCQESHCRRYDEKRNLPQPRCQAPADGFRTGGVRTQRSRHRGEFRRGYGHAEQAYRQRIKKLRVGKPRHGAGR